MSNAVTLNPVKKWNVDLIQHSHTDIGYTRSQTEILAEHIRYFDYALDYCDATDNYPENEKFRWTCEASWPVDEFLKCRPAEQVDRLLRRIKEGRIEVTGMYFNFDEIPDEQILAASLAAAGRIKTRGIPVTLAMQNDVNGIGWCMNDYFNQLGIKYLNMGTHGHRALICFDKPTMFWWESPSGKRILTFRAEHYMTGNTLLEIQNGDLNKFQNNLLTYLKNLESLKYPFNEIAIQLSGYLTDNSPPSTLASEMIRKWDEVFEWPKISNTTAESFFRKMENEHGDEFPVIRGAWEANRRTASLGEDAMGLLQSMFKREKEPSLIVFNTLNWKRSGLTMIYIDHQIVPQGSTAGIYDTEGNRVPVQDLSSRSDGTYWAVWLNDIPPFGFKKFLIRPLNEENASISKEAPEFLENKWYKIIPDYSRGTIRSWFDKELALELVDKNSEYGMAEFILEQLGNRSQMERKMLVDFKRSPLDTIWFDSVTKGPVFNSIKFFGESETTINPKGYSFEIRLYNTEKRVEIVCSIIKKSITDPESFYIAFPFDIKNGKHFTEVQGVIIETGKDQIKGSSNDWYSVQNFTSVRNSDAQLVMGCSEMPLMQFGAINTGRYQAGAMPQSTHVFSWPMNNYWVTNFNADQRGGHSWIYYLTTSNDISDNFASRFGWGSRVPYLTRILPGEGTGDNKTEGSFIEGWPVNIILVSARPSDDGKTILVHLREINGKEAHLSLKNGLTGNQLEISGSDVTGKPFKDSVYTIKPLESKFFLIKTGF
jgi:hypothetical protein